MRIRYYLGCSVVAILLITGCTATPSLMECQNAASAHEGVHDFIAKRRSEPTAAEMSNQLLAVGARYENLKVSGELRAASQAIARDVKVLQAYYEDASTGPPPDPGREQKHVNNLIDSLTQAEKLCSQIG